MRYLEQKHHSRKVAKEKYFRLIGFISDMQNFKQRKEELAKDWDFDKFPPIVKELYELI